MLTTSFPHQALKPPTRILTTLDAEALEVSEAMALPFSEARKLVLSFRYSMPQFLEV